MDESTDNFRRISEQQGLGAITSGRVPIVLNSNGLLPGEGVGQAGATALHRDDGPSSGAGVTRCYTDAHMGCLLVDLSTDAGVRRPDGT